MFIQRHKIVNLWVYSFIVLLIVLLFTKQPTNMHFITSMIWETGHLILFFFIARAILATVPLNNFIFIKLTGIALIVALATEVAQIPFGRNFQLTDLLSDLSGAWCYFFYHQIKINNQNKKLSYIAILAIISTHLLPILLSSINHLALQSLTPQLVKFNNSFDHHYWSAINSSIEVSDNTLVVNTQPGTYSGIKFQYFSSQWQQFSTLHIDIANNDNKVHTITLRVSDRTHNNKAANYYDRFNTEVKLTPGRNSISIPLDVIKDAPKNRKMNLNEIVDITLFFQNKKQNSSISFFQIYLG